MVKQVEYAAQCTNPGFEGMTEHMKAASFKICKNRGMCQDQSSEIKEQIDNK